jgi:hypothetical protein
MSMTNNDGQGFLYPCNGFYINPQYELAALTNSAYLPHAPSLLWYISLVYVPSAIWDYNDLSCK